jgi:signal transduction histidine kinase
VERVTLLARLHRLARMRPHADIALAVVVCAVTLITTATSAPMTPGVVAAAAVGCGSLVLLHRWPLAVLLVSAGAAEMYLATLDGHGGTMIVAAPLAALCTVAAEQGDRRRRLIIGALAILALAGVHMLVKPSSSLGAENLALAAFGGLAVAAGDASRSRRAYLAEVEARAQRAEAEREAEAARRVTEERLRIARELHDVLGHQLALIKVQAAVADQLLPEQPGRSREALAHISTASGAALRGLRDTIGLLRAGEEAPDPLAPTTGLTGLPQLLASFRRSGLAIDESVRGSARAAPVPVDLTAYRVIQESLTNVCKHAGPTTVDLTLDYRDDALRIVVRNRPTGRPVVSAGGHGLVGMRERVSALAGSLSAGPRPDGGFQVTATLPLAGAAG